MSYSYILNKTANQSGIQFLNSVQKSVTLVKESKQQGICHYFDTFDWRLYHQGYCLYVFNGYIYLYHYKKKKIEVKKESRFTNFDDFKYDDSIVFGKISPIIGVRALISHATFRRSIQSFRIINKDKKTTARLVVEQSKIKDKSKYKSLGLYFEISPLRGYANQVSGILQKLHPDNLSPCKEDLLTRGLKIIGRIPADYSSKINIKLTNRMSAIDAAKKIYLNLLQMIRINENGILQDIDIEFLHDFRVAVRRTRSAFGQIKGILDNEVAMKTKDYFSYLGRSTNKLRDIDVYLLREQQYKLMVPVELKQYLNPFFQGLKEKRKTEHQSLIKIINSAKYKRVLSEWELFLKADDVQDHLKLMTVRELARNVITKRNHKVLNLGQKILLLESDDMLHQLRIEGKKLRYLLEFFQSLFPKEKIQILINKLKLLQDNLGDLNDLILQQERLIDSAREIYPASRVEKNIALTFGILIGKLNEKQLTIKKDFAKIYSDYADPDVQKIYKEIFQAYRRRVR